LFKEKREVKLIGPMDLKPFCCFKKKTEVELVGQGVGTDE
jgi:hypothetical protein